LPVAGDIAAPLGRPLAGGARALRLLELGRQLGIGQLSRSPKFLNQRRIGRCIQLICREHQRLTPRAFDLHPQPLKVLARLGSVRQDIDSLFDGDGAQLLQTPPGPNPQIRRCGRQLVHQDQPAVPALGRCWLPRTQRTGGRTGSWHRS